MVEPPVELRRVASPSVPWAELDRRTDRTVFQTQPWLDFLAESQGAEPVLAVVRRGREAVGWFTGAMVHRGGLKVLGSPMQGWSTSYMGFNLDAQVPPSVLLEAVRRFAFGQLGCLHVELMDRSFHSSMSVPPPFRVVQLAGYERRIDVDDDALMAGMTRNGRRDVRRALRNGIVVQEVDPGEDPGFAAQYYEQVTESFAKRSLVPTYPLERVRSMIRHLHPTGHLLLLRAHLPDGRPAATGIFPGLQGAGAVFWMGASCREHQALLPNEALMWHAMRAWRSRGAVTLDFGGGGSYKSKYGGDPLVVPWLRTSRFGVLELGRTLAQGLMRRAQQRAGRAAS